MAKILITNAGTTLDKGDEALLNSRVETLREMISDAHFVILTYFPEMACLQNGLEKMEVIAKPVSLRMLIAGTAYIVFIRPWRLVYKFLGEFVDISIKGRKLHEIADTYNPEIIKMHMKKSSADLYAIVTAVFLCSFWRFLNKYLHVNAKSLLREKRLQEYSTSDAIINMGGDGLTETSPSLYFIINLLFGILLGKHVILYAESMSPGRFKGWERYLARFVLNSASLITLREELSKKALQELNINKPPIYVTADSAFLLKTASVQRIDEIFARENIGKNNHPIIGFSVSGFATRFGQSSKSPKEKEEEYIKMLAQSVDYLIDTLDAMIIFIPHNIAPGGDDRLIANAICQRTKNKKNIISIINEYTSEELKGVIGSCDLFIGTRMHATIASTSMCVPTISIAYGHKAHGIIGEMLGQDKYVLDIGGFTGDELISKINDAWNNKEDIRNDLEQRIEIVKERALFNAILVKEILEKSKGFKGYDKNV